MATGWSETVDRVVASIGNVAITQSDVEAEYRFELFLESKFPAPPPDAQTLARVRDRLIEQKLLAQEAATEGTETTDPPSAVAERLDDVRKKFGSEEAFQSALRAGGLDQGQIVARLGEQERMLRLIDQRFRPAAWPEQAEIEPFYRNTFLPEQARRTPASPPPLAEVEEKIREILLERNINHLLEAWLTEMKSSYRVKVHAF